MSKILVNINGKEIEAYKKQTILEVCNNHNINIPTLCHSEMLENYGSCGLCVVEVEGTNKLLRACSTEIGDGMIIKTNSERIYESRKTTLELLLSYHTGDCKAPCSQACPGKVDVQGYVGLIANEQYDEALKLIKEKLPLPAAIGRVCPHPCQTDCRRDVIEDSISIAWLKRYVADMDLEKETSYLPEIEADQNKHVSVIGGGPGGLSAAYFLRKKGYQVTVYEAMPEFGGMLKYGIPLYRLPKDVLKQEIKLIKDMGVKLVPNTKIGRDISLDHIREHSDAVYVSIGAWKSSMIPCKGHDLNRVHGGIEFLNKFAINEPIKTGKKIAIIGGGNTAMDTCRTSIRLGAEKVYALYRRTKDDMPAVDVEIEEAIEEGVEFKFLLNPVEILDDGNGNVAGIKVEKMKPLGKDSRGRTKIEATGEYETIEVDSVIMSIGQKLDNTGLEEIELNDWGNIKSDESTWQTNLEGVFAGGDCANEGADIAIHAIYDGRVASDVIDSYLHGEIKPVEEKYYVKKKDVNREDFPSIVSQETAYMSHESPEIRKHNFEEIVHGYTEKNAIEEATRCLECGCNEVFKCDLLEHSNDYSVAPDRFEGAKEIHAVDDRHEYIIKDSNKCIHCSMCIRACDEVMDYRSLGLANRGFDTVVLPALDKALEETNCVSCGQCITVCPTGALQEKMPVKKPIPVLPKVTHTTCSSCSIGCQLNIESKGDLLLKAIPDFMDYTSKGLLCAKGKFGISHVNDDNRILKPMVRKNGYLEEVSFEEAILYAARKAQSMDLLYDKNTLGVSISEKWTNEEIYLAKEYAEEILQTENIFNINGRKSGLKEILTIDASTNTLNEIANTDLVITIGKDLMEDYMIAALKVKSAYDNNAMVININDEITKIDDWATESIIGEDITKVLSSIYKAVDEEQELDGTLAKVVNALGDKKKAMIVYDAESVSATDEMLIAAICNLTGHIGSPRNGIIKLRKHINGQGLVDMGVSNDSEKYLEKIEKKDIRGLLVLGNELPENEVLESLEFLMVMTTHLDEKVKKADVIMPMATLLESKGTITTNDRRILKVNPVLESKIGYTNLEIIKELMNVYSTNIDFDAPEEILQKICKNNKNYDGLLSEERTVHWPVKSTRILFDRENPFEKTRKKMDAIDMLVSEESN